MTAYTSNDPSTDSSACSPAHHHKASYYKIASLIFTLNYAISFFVTSISLLASLIAWLFCLIFAIIYKLLLKEDEGNTVALPLASAAHAIKRGSMFVRTPAAAPEVAVKEKAPIFVAHAIHPPLPTHAVASRANPFPGFATPYRGTARYAFTTTETRRAPDTSFAPGSAIFTRKDMGMDERCVRADARVFAEGEAKREYVRQVEGQRRVAVSERRTDTQCLLTPQVAPLLPSPQSSPPCDTSTLDNAYTWAAAVQAASDDVCTSFAPCSFVVAPSPAITNGTEAMEWDNHPLEPEHSATEDIIMDDDSLCSSDEPMNDAPSPVFPALNFIDVIVTSVEEDSAHIIRACSLSGAECASSALPSMDTEFPAVDEVAAALSACSLAERFDQMGMDTSGDVAMAGDDDDDDSMLGCSLLDVACPAHTLPLMDVSIAEDMDVDYDDFPALKTALSSLLGSGRRVSRLVKRHQRTRTRVEHPPHDSTPAPKPNVTVLRLVNKYADLGIDAEGVMFRVQLDVGLAKVVKVSRVA
ncbi:hypothetical protein BOTBODRAFT_178264 [Botryobasidium botryosum FD-172 SS1]|uniref:Uncharacterized protein n=1 Tax=Botryobasidium botryosum (strain FD-172 SS1) TaxID=930990 RepID=A0A067M3T5_BOTB1|nr:hypothetical protein BOTBODRAFT_178264 [Botryobasidium botryosum FD-172 SS1]